MEEKRKRIIAQIENKKNQAIKDLTDGHAVKYQKIKNYYQEITNTNLDIIKQLKEELAEAKKEDASKQKQLMDQRQKHEEVIIPMKEANEEILELKAIEKKYAIIDEKLDKEKVKITANEKIIKEMGWEYEVKLQQFEYLEQEKLDIFQSFYNHIYDIHQKAGLKNLILEKQLETIEESIEIKEAQLNELLNAAKIDQSQLKEIKSTLEQAERYKNERIREIQQELKRIREAHSTMVKTYEGKLSEFGIPVEELGFDPLVPANI